MGDPMQQYRQVSDVPLPWQERSARTTIPVESSSARLDQTLASGTEQEKVQDLGERLFLLVQQLQPELAGKITGMLLEMEHDEIRRLIATPLALKAKVEEAIAVLQAYQAKQLYAAKLTAKSVLCDPLPPPQASQERAPSKSYSRPARLKQQSTRWGN